MKCCKCGQVMVRLEDGTLDCGCVFTEEDYIEYPSLERDSDGFHGVIDEGLSES